MAQVFPGNTIVAKTRSKKITGPYLDASGDDLATGDVPLKWTGGGWPEVVNSP